MNIKLTCDLTPDEAKALEQCSITVLESVPWEFVRRYGEQAELNGITPEHLEEGKLTAAELLLLVEGLSPDYIMRDAEALPKLIDHIEAWRNPPELSALDPMPEELLDDPPEE